MKKTTLPPARTPVLWKLSACLKTLPNRRVRARGLRVPAGTTLSCRPGPLTGRVFKHALLKRYNGPANGFDRAAAVAVDGSGSVVVTGASWNGTNADYYTAKYAAADGALLWEKRYNGPANSGDYARAVAVDGSDNVV